MNKFGQVQTILDKFEQVWKNLDHELGVLVIIEMWYDNSLLLLLLLKLFSESTQGQGQGQGIQILRSARAELIALKKTTLSLSSLMKITTSLLSLGNIKCL